MVANRSKVPFNVEAAICGVLGDDAAGWMARPSRLLDGMAPADLATSPEGARVVLHELKQASIPIKAIAARSRKRV